MSYNGRPAVDPVRLIKMMLLGYLFGVPSERRLVKEIQVNVAYRWFLRMGLTEKVPDASTLSQNRIRRFNGSDVFQQIFDHIVEQALAQGMANGRVLYTDSTHLKASANPRKAVNELRPEGVSEYIDQLNAAVEADRKKHEKKPLPGVKRRQQAPPRLRIRRSAPRTRKAGLCTGKANRKVSSGWTTARWTASTASLPTRMSLRVMCTTASRSSPD
ncbi:hypothetical protein Y11_12071 [Yersinia enterocolitica subsp. palearctica Y11]|uniref:Transposase InsH N-terminal domain-containing protein n=1 Tax=Yersinia enterocolitica subsp. palearctica serotype O:3 (strain DSM 13030 / CIP 106945 / Y11) TaxID=930944 RepID=A0A0H3NP96_YERE1|nr:hypothetical protein Y11_12071 [Yersinia enterocolitica subsp. palearctica Y11]